MSSTRRPNTCAAAQPSLTRLVSSMVIWPMVGSGHLSDDDSMEPLRVFTWHVHGSYLLYLSQMPHEIYVPVRAGRPNPYGGLGGPFPWPPNIHEIPVEDVSRQRFDCILFQRAEQYLVDQYEILSPEQRRLPR